MGIALDAALDALEKDTSARIIIFSGAGGHFCAGLDLTEVGSQGTEAERLAALKQRISGAPAPASLPADTKRLGELEPVKVVEVDPELEALKRSIDKL
jgi:hypothetical protein